jgi:tripartite-type tricarboxylate transporter receptor subunit TctC
MLVFQPVALGQERMKLPRRKFLHLAAGAAALPGLSRIARALPYPTRPVRIIIGFPAGGGADIVGRLIGQWLSERLNQPFVVDNRPGAASNIATEAVGRAAPDGYTLLLVTLPANAVNAALYKLNFNFIHDIAPVASLTRDPNVMEVTPSLPVRSVPQFISYAKANPGKINMASSGIGASQHIAGELFMEMTGVQMNHVPYRGAAPALTDLMSGQVDVFFDVTTSSIAHIKAGSVRALAVTTAARSAALPDIPTVDEFVPGYEASNVRGIGAPRNTPVEVIDTLNKEINAALADPAIKARLADLGASVLAGSAADFGSLIMDETEKWAKVVKAGGIKPE